MSFSAEVPRPGRTGSLRVPFKNRELGTAALDHKPVNGIAGLGPTDLAPELLHGCHKFPIVPQAFFLRFHSSVRFRTGRSGSGRLQCRRPSPYDPEFN